MTCGASLAKGKVVLGQETDCSNPCFFQADHMFQSGNSFGKKHYGFCGSSEEG